jgi:serine/threonine protein kinase
MPAPTTIIELLDLVNRSSLLEKRQLDSYLEKLANDAEQPGTPKHLANAMVRDGMLTTLQAGLLLRGKYKKFIVSGKYKLLEHLGTGGMGSVYLCEHVLMQRRVALKVLPTERVTDRVVLERFYREARAVAALDHRNIVRAYDIDHDEDMHFLVLEFVDGSSLHRIVEKYGPMAIGRAVNCIAQAADGLQHAHEAGLVHRDIKPGNLLLDRLGVIKILDLGLARFFDDEASQLTQRQDPGTVLGTADYVAPEQAIDSSNVDIRSDIYSLGVTLFFLLTGRSPYKDGSVSQKLMWHQISPPTPVTEYRPEVPRKLAAVIERMLVKDPANRYQTPAEVVQALAPWDDGVTMPPDKEMPRLCPAVAQTSTLRLAPATRPLAAPPSNSSRRPGSRWARLMANSRAKTTLLLATVAFAAIGGALAAIFASR